MISRARCFFVLFSCCCFVPSSLSLSLSLSSTQNEIMGKLSESIPAWKDGKEASPCTWKGVNCSSDSSSVTHISLSGFSLSDSSFLPLVCGITSLEALDLSNNHIPSIPRAFFTACGKMDGLKSLNFSNNRLIGPLPAFTTGFLGLESLDFSFNSLNGGIVSELGSLIRLKHLCLTSNKFSGGVPVNLGSAKALESLLLNLNSFTGPFPDQLLQYPNLSLIDLSYNQLSGPLPSTIAAQLPRLHHLILSSNNFIGQIPDKLSNIQTLSRFAANQNSFTGSIPVGLSTFLQNLDLSFNQLGGRIPDDLLQHPNLESVDLSSNLLQGPMPALFSLNLVRLRLGSNSLNGTIPSALSNLSYLTYLELDNNSFSGSIPPQLASCRRLALLNLGMNRLTGLLPVGLASLDRLQVLKLHSNQLEGEIPTHINEMHSLSILNMGGNLVTGSIPTSISGLQNLTNLNLEDNRLTGSIPPGIESLKNLLELQLGNNRLSGDIPRMPLSLQIALNLSHNHFQGPIPESFARLTSLEVLDLSNNRFSGQIPTFLTALTALTQLLLANNLLSGEIPQFGPYVTTLDINGNNGLVNTTKISQEKRVLGGKRKPAAAVVAVAVAIGAAAATAALGIGVIVVSRRFYRVKEYDGDEGLEAMPQRQVAVVQANLLTSNGIHRSNIDFTRAIEAVAPSNMLLKTRFSTYYKAVMPCGTSYLVKKTMDFNWRGGSSSHEKKLKLLSEELELLGKLSNSNVMTPLAYVLTMDSAYLLYEYAHKGNLFDILHHHDDEALDWASRYSIAVGIAQGLAFLHASSSSSPLFLLDLSTKTVMLKSVKEPQIGDIELYKLIAPSRTSRSLSTIAGSVGYVPPEYAYTMMVTAAGNVYSFGVILLELLTGKSPVSEGTELARWVLDNTNNAALQHKLDRILDSRISRTSLAVRTQMLAVLKVALACVTFLPEARPKMKTVLRMLLNAR